MVNNIKVYSTPHCPWCKKTRDLLEENKIPYESIDVSASKSARDEMINKTGHISVPVIDIDGDIIVGYDEALLKEKLGLAKF